MRALYQISKTETQPVSYPFDFNPWLQSIGSTFASATVGDAPGISESYTIAAGVVNVTVTGGSGGETYRIPVTCTAANGQSRSSVLEVWVIGVADSPSSSGSTTVNVQDSLDGNATNVAPSIRAVNAALVGLTAAGDIDGGLHDSTYDNTSAIDGGGP